MKAFKSWKITKAPGFDQIDVNVINRIYNHIKKPLIRIFGDSIKLGVFSEKLKFGLPKGFPNFQIWKKRTSNELQTSISFAMFFKDPREDYV